MGSIPVGDSDFCPTPRVDSSVSALTHRDPRDLGVICLLKKRMIRFVFFSD